MSSSLLLFPQRFGRFVLRPSSGVCQTREPSIKDVVRSSVKVPVFGKHLKRAGRHIGRNVVEITIKMKTIVQKPLMIKINKLRLRNLDKWNILMAYQTVEIILCQEIKESCLCFRFLCCCFLRVLFSQFYVIKYSYLILIIYTYIVLRN